MHKSQLQRQAEEVERIDAAIAEELAASTEAPQVTEEAAETEASEELETQEETVAEEQTQPEPTPPPVQDDSAKWEQRYNTLAGKYNAEVPRLSSEIKDLKGSLEAAIAKLEAKAEAPPEVERKVEKLLTAQDSENFGEDMVDFVKRAAADIVSDREREMTKEIAKLKEQNAKLKSEVSTVAEVQTKAAGDQMLVELERLVPDWQQLNVDQNFLDWLSAKDQLSGYTRHQLLQMAEQAKDVGQIANVFLAYKQTLPVEAPRPKKPDVQAHVTPGKSKSSSSGSKSEDATKVWTGAEIDQFYTSVRAGKYKTKPEDARKVEAQIDLAVQQGRIR